MLLELAVELVPPLRLEVEETAKLVQSTLGSQSLILDGACQSIHLLRKTGRNAVPGRTRGNEHRGDGWCGGDVERSQVKIDVAHERYGGSRRRELVGLRG